MDNAGTLVSPFPFPPHRRPRPVSPVLASRPVARPGDFWGALRYDWSHPPRHPWAWYLGAKAVSLGLVLLFLWAIDTVWPGHPTGWSLLRQGLGGLVSFFPGLGL